MPNDNRIPEVSTPGYPVITLRPIEGLEFVGETVAALGSSGELAHHLFQGVLGGGNGQRPMPGVRLGEAGGAVPRPAHCNQANTGQPQGRACRPNCG